MKTKTKKIGRNPGAAGKGRLAHELEGGAAGMLTGAVVGAAGGPPGIVAGAVLGAAAGAAAGAAIDAEGSARSRRERELDAEIGVTEGSLGAANLMHPPPARGAYSAASSGVASPGAAPAEGPIQVPEE